MYILVCVDSFSAFYFRIRRRHGGLRGATLKSLVVWHQTNDMLATFFKAMRCRGKGMYIKI